MGRPGFGIPTISPLTLPFVVEEEARDGGSGGGEGREVGVEVEDGGCGFEDVEERVNTKAGGT